MQGKVSMVVPCYNKEEYIDEMLDSIIAQSWDNIELILVNDDSTDRTREIITEYEPKFRKRGYEIVIIDQKNAGVCAAAKNGLEQARGDYICVVDADDELDPNYVSTLAGWLEEHNDYDFTVCEHVKYTGSGRDKSYIEQIPKVFENDDPYILEKFLLHLIRPFVWVYMVRKEYLHKCRIIETYYVETKGSHEPGFVLPLLANGGKMKFFPLPLYRFNVNDEGHSRKKQFEQALAYDLEYIKLSHFAIETLSDATINETKKAKLKEVSTIGRYVRLYYNAKKMLDGDDHKDFVFKTVLEHTNTALSINLSLNVNLYSGLEHRIVTSIKKALVGQTCKYNTISNGRVVGYGVLGRRAQRWLPLLKGTCIDPTELWDVNGDGINVKTPNFNELGSDDLVLVFPIGDVETKLRAHLADMPFKKVFDADLGEFLLSPITI